ncbi:probable M18 family aminopeptidase 1 [Treponema primitia ZAS-2]|uniref:M18 family aminopeptidase n=1 Tax=Treponema primitia (strain ATCC BAA-887 / DSM 12427 / ZAS-2) TaxID=545694 RepID=F5YPX4_TREPZ|nr:aminopeptidase [Treponema primitia]AEF86551.1 probable M18 family aminopeptidase 1 [Treponema primitia ZAS-2]
MGTNSGEEKKTEGQQLSEKLFFEIKNCWDTATGAELEEVETFGKAYKQFLDAGKTEREFTRHTVELLKEKGFQDLNSLLNEKGTLSPGSKVYQLNRDKSLVFAVIGKRPLTEGINIVGAHVDSPRIDLKTNPIYEDSELALLDTHYYGGIKPYQWTAIALAMHGTVVGKDGKKRDICIGEDEGDPVFTITDLLPHLARDQMQKKAADFIDGEGLDILAGSRPYKDPKAKDKVKLNLLSLIHDKYGILEEDFAGAEFEFVPAQKARDLGLDRSMIGGYGHDDRSCSFAALKALLDFSGGTPPEKTVVCLLTDKEEVGSMGNTGAQSRLFENFVAYLGVKTLNSYSEIALRQCLGNSSMLSADVNAAFDPNFDSVFDKKTSSYFGKGLVLSKFTGRGGKAGGSEANAEFCQKVQGILNKNTVRWQYGELGKVDKGGGGTIALHVANLGVEVLDCGIPVLSMHSPFEVISKIDLYTAYRGYLAFLREA